MEASKKKKLDSFTDPMELEEDEPGTTSGGGEGEEGNGGVDLFTWLEKYSSDSPASVEDKGERSAVEAHFKRVRTGISER